MRKNTLEIGYVWILFLFWPFLAFLIALKKGFSKNYQNIILAFSFLYGYSVFLYSGDILAYEESYYILLKYTWNDYWFWTTNIANPNTTVSLASDTVHTKPDFFAFTLQFLTSRISNTPRLFWGLVSLIYTKFMLMFFSQVFASNRLNTKHNLHYVLIIFLIVIVPFYVGVTGVRFWTSLFLFMYFVLRYSNDSYKSKYVFGSLLTVLIHYSFVVPVVLLFIFHFIPLKKVLTRILLFVALGFYFLSSTTSTFNQLEQLVETSDENVYKENAEGYSNIEIFKARKKQASEANWYVSFRADAIFYLLTIAILFEISFIRLNETEVSHHLFPLIIVFLSLTLVTYNLGSLGRFQYVFYLLVLSRYTIIYTINAKKLFMKVFLFFLTPILILHILVSFRTGFYTVDTYLLFNNSIGVFLIRSTESLSEFLVGH